MSNYQRSSRDPRLALVNFKAFVYFLLAQVVVAFIATQYTAHALAYDARLGAPMFWKVYAPGKSLIWMIQFNYMGGVVRKILFKDGIFEIIGHFLAVLGLFFAVMRNRTKFQQENDSYGSARWRNEKEMQESKLLADGSGKGVIIGAYVDERGRERYLTHTGDDHFVLFAPSGGGKTTSVVIPTMLGGLCNESVLTNDMKRELWQLTAGWRASQGHTCIKYDPLDPGTARYNPLNRRVLRIGTELESIRLQLLGNAIVPTGKQAKDDGLEGDHWIMTARQLVSGLAAHVVYAEPDPTLGTLADILGGLMQHDGQRVTLMRYLTAAIKYKHREAVQPGYDWPYDGDYHPQAIEGIGNFLDTEARQRSSILTSAQKWFASYRHIPIRRATSACDFLVEDLTQYETPVSLYIAISPGYHEVLKPLVRTLLNQIFAELCDDLKKSADNTAKAYKHRLRLLLDEFVNIGRMDTVSDGFSYCRDYGLSIAPIIQDYSQLWGVYGKDEVITANCNIRAAFAPNKSQTAEELVKYLGDFTERQTAKTYTGARFSAFLSHMVAQEQDHGRKLLTVDEILTMDPQDTLIFQRGKKPIQGRLIPYYEDGELRRRAEIPAPETARIPHPELETAFVPPAMPYASILELNFNEETKEVAGTGERAIPHTAEMMTDEEIEAAFGLEIDRTGGLAPAIIDEIQRMDHQGGGLDHGL